MKGRGIGWDTPSSLGPLWSPPEAGRKFSSLNLLDAKGAEAKFWLSASNIGRGGGGGRGSKGVGCGSRGAYPPSSYSVWLF